MNVPKTSLAPGTGVQKELQTGRDNKKNGQLELCKAFILQFTDQAKINCTNK